MRPLVVGPSPVITPSRTMPSAHTATSQSFFDISTALASSSDIPAKVHIGLLFLLPDPCISCRRQRAVKVTSPFGHIDLRAERVDFMGRMRRSRKSPLQTHRFGCNDFLHRPDAEI